MSLERIDNRYKLIWRSDLREEYSMVLSYAFDNHGPTRFEIEQRLFVARLDGQVIVSENNFFGSRSLDYPSDRRCEFSCDLF
jgi:hypothetical protein